MQLIYIVILTCKWRREWEIEWVGDCGGIGGGKEESQPPAIHCHIDDECEMEGTCVFSRCCCEL